MTVASKNIIKAHSWNAAIVLTLLGIFWKASALTMTLTKDIETNRFNIHENTVRIEVHKTDLKDHKPMDGLMNTFVPRVELEKEMKAIREFQEKTYNLILRKQ